MSTIQVYQGVGFTWTSQIPNNLGQPATGIYLGTELLYGAVFTGSAFAQPAFLFNPVWHGGAPGGPLGLVDLVFTPASTTGIWPGTYEALVTLADFSQPLIQETLIILPSPVGTVVIGNTPSRALADLGLLKRVQLPLSKINIQLDAASPISQFDDPLMRAVTFMGIAPQNPVIPSDPDFVGIATGFQQPQWWAGANNVNPWTGGINQPDDPSDGAAGYEGYIPPPQTSGWGAGQALTRNGPTPWQELLDIAEAECLMWAVTTHAFMTGNYSDERWPDYSYRRDPQSMQWLQKLAETKMQRCRKMYRYDTSKLVYGTIDLGFQANISRYDQTMSEEQEIS